MPPKSKIIQPLIDRHSTELWAAINAMKDSARDKKALFYENPFRWIARDFLPSRCLLEESPQEQAEEQAMQTTSTSKRRASAGDVEDPEAMDIAGIRVAADPNPKRLKTAADMTDGDWASQDEEMEEQPQPGANSFADREGQHISALEFLKGREFLDYVTELNSANIDAETCRPELNTILRPWQAVGERKLCMMARSMFQGGFLADPVGLGKSLTALVAALKIRKDLQQRKHSYRFILVVCRKSCVLQWYREITTHFKKELRPSVIILDSVDYPVKDLLDFDVVITTQGFLRARFREVENIEYFIDLAHAYGVDYARKKTNMIGPLRRPRQPLHSPLYDTLKANIAVLIVDESQDAKNPDSELRNAILSLKYYVVFLLTGTPAHNRLSDLYGQMSLLPGCPLVDLEHSRLVFDCPVQPNNNTATRTTAAFELQNQDNPRRRMLKALLSGMMVARPKDVVTLRGIRVETVEVDMNWQHHFLSLFIIERAVRIAGWFLSNSRKASTPKRRIKYLHKALGQFAKAEAYSASPLLRWEL
ncbi:hypothetical protein NUW58_g4239 [Xylaria curta]|uniref:Uncharacterized protein n=1 Tax=Xylaria curta TaxID=42375 RepID=A0ACC1P9Z3_9PEZI|nr:hypothetical protein NUW58_g4239 [Xylaria curta]